MAASLIFGTALIAELVDTEDYSYFGHRLIINTVLTTTVSIRARAFPATQFASWQLIGDYCIITAG